MSWRGQCPEGALPQGAAPEKVVIVAAHRGPSVGSQTQLQGPASHWWVPIRSRTCPHWRQITAWSVRIVAVGVIEISVMPADLPSGLLVRDGRVRSRPGHGSMLRCRASAEAAGAARDRLTLRANAATTWPTSELRSDPLARSLTIAVQCRPALWPIPSRSMSHPARQPGPARRHWIDGQGHVPAARRCDRLGLCAQ